MREVISDGSLYGMRKKIEKPTKQGSRIRTGMYKRVFGTSMRIRDGDSKTGTASDDFPYYEIPGQMSIEDFIKADEK